MKLHLHANRLIVPRGKSAPLDVTAPLPPHMSATWELLGFDAHKFAEKDE
jgi:23S rRNA pseudouridine955/2504/2580 synthase